jgi:hypothetical protein
VQIRLGVVTGLNLAEMCRLRYAALACLQHSAVDTRSFRALPPCLSCALALDERRGAMALVTADVSRLPLVYMLYVTCHAASACHVSRCMPDTRWHPEGDSLLLWRSHVVYAAG